MLRVALAVLPILAAGDLLAQHVSCRTNYYSVTGADLREIHQSFRQSRPWRETAGHDGFTVWTVNWRFTTAYSSSICRLTTFSTTTTVTITLPRWIMPTNASDSLKAEWTRYIQALGQHEYGHAQFAMVTAAEMQKAAKQVGEDASCDGLKQRLSALCNSLLDKYKQLDEAYDQKTQHGIQQGAYLGRGSRPFPRDER